MEKMPRMEKKFDFRQTAKHAADRVGHAVQDYRRQQETKAAAQREAVLQRIRAEEEQRLQKRNRALSEIQQLIDAPPSTTTGGAAIRNGAAQVIARVAHNDPEYALRLAEMVRENVEVYNESLLGLHEETVGLRVKAEETLKRLHDRPYRTHEGFALADKLLPVIPRDANRTNEKRTAGQVAVGILRGTGRVILKAVDGGLGFGTRFTAAAIQGDMKSLGDSIEIQDDKVTIRSPGQQIAKATFKLKDLHAGKVKVSPEWPKWADGIVGVFGSMIEPEKVERLVPWGQMVAFSTERDKVIASVPVFFPGKKAKEFNQLIEDSEMPHADLPDFIPEPSPAELVTEFGRRSGITRAVSPEIFRLRANMRRRRVEPEEQAGNDLSEEDATTRARRLFNI